MLIDVSDLDVTYPGGKAAVRSVSFAVAPGQVLGLLGGNGAGKSTTMRVLAGVVPPTAGTVLVAGHDMSSRTDADRARARTGYCPDVGGLPRVMSVRECIGLALASTGNLRQWPAAYDLAERLDLTRVLDEPIASFSHGMTRRTSALLAFLTASDILLLDEPFDGVDADGVQVLGRMIAEAAHAGLAVVVCTHLLSAAASMTNQAVIMVAGRVAASMPSSELAGADGGDRYARLIASTMPGSAAHTPALTGSWDRTSA